MIHVSYHCENGTSNNNNNNNNVVGHPLRIVPNTRHVDFIHCSLTVIIADECGSIQLPALLDTFLYSYSRCQMKALEVLHLLILWA